MFAQSILFEARCKFAKEGNLFPYFSVVGFFPCFSARLWEQAKRTPKILELFSTKYRAGVFLLLSIKFILLSTGTYFYTLVQTLVNLGYRRDDDIRGAPYDWRKAPSK